MTDLSIRKLAAGGGIQPCTWTRAIGAHQAASSNDVRVQGQVLQSHICPVRPPVRAGWHTDDPDDIWPT